MARVLKFIFIIFVSAIIIFACRKERPKPSWNVDLLTPLFIDTTTIYDVINDSLLQENPDQSISFVFDEKLFEVNMDSMVKLPDTLFSYFVSMEYLPGPQIVPPGYIISSVNLDWPLDFDYMDLEGVELESAFVKSGKIKFDVLNQADGYLMCKFGINSAIKNNVDTFLISEQVVPDQFLTKTFDFSEYRLDLTGAGDTAYNILNYFIEIIVDTAYLDSMLILPVDSFLINVTFEEIVIDYAKGYFGQNLLVVGPETQSFSFLEDLDIGGLSMKDATINIKIENNYGADGMFKINEIIASNISTGNSMPLQGDMIDSNLFIAAATQTGDGLHIITPSNSTFDFSNTNFNDLLQIVPDEISYTIEVLTNPLGDSTNHNNFYYKDVPINVFVEAEVSQGIRIEDLNVVCTEPWNGEGVELEKVISGQLMLAFSNGFPFTFNMDFYLLDDSYNIIYTLFDQELIAGAIPGPDGKVTNPVETNLNLVLTEDLRSSIKLAKYGRYGITVNSVENEHVKIYGDYIMRFKINGDFEFKIEQ